MPATVLVIQNDEIDTLGSFSQALDARGILLTTIKPYDGQAVPSAIGHFGGLIVLGGPQGAYEADIYQYLEDEMKLMRSCIEAIKPLFGICLGAQLLAGALGARVYKHTVKEVGWKPVTFTPAGIDDQLFRDLGNPLTLLEWHGDTFDLPDGAVLLASSEVTPHQVIRFGKHAYGIQFHLEAEYVNVKTLVDSFPESMEAGGVDSETVMSDTAIFLPKMLELADRVFGRWIDLLD